MSIRYFKYSIIILLLGLLFLAGCNIFSWTYNKDNVDALISEGEAALEKGEYAKALEAFDKALAKEPNNSKALYGYAQAKYMERLGVDQFQRICDRFLDKPDTNDIFLDPTDFNFSDDATGFRELFEFLGDISEKLDKIVEGEADGTISSVSFTPNLDCAIIHAFRCVSFLGSYDPNITVTYQEEADGEGEYHVDFSQTLLDLDTSREPLLTSFREANKALDCILIAIENSSISNNREVQEIQTFIEIIRDDIAFFSD